MLPMIILLLLLGAESQAHDSAKELKFGNVVRVVDSTYTEYSDIGFVRGLAGVVVSRRYSSYAKECSGRIVYAVNICTESRDCHEFDFCRTDLKFIREKR